MDHGMLFLYKGYNPKMKRVHKVDISGLFYRHNNQTDLLISLTISAYLLGIIGVTGTLVPFVRQDDYWIRGFDYPRLQIAVLLLTSIILWLIGQNSWTTFNLVVLGVLSSALVYQVARILPYTPVYPHQSRDATARQAEDTTLSLMICNVLQTNEQYRRVIKLVLEQSPDLLITLESDQIWGRELHTGLDDTYAHHIDVPKDNLYGMHLFSRLPFVSAEVKYRIKEDIPSIDVTITRKDGTEVDLYFLHPLPPSPTEAYASTGRDAELSKVGLEIREKGRPAIVAGDMNDVAWSFSSRLFQRISKLCDPRRGRGLFATFHAEHWWARWPLDHVFHHPDFAVVDLRRLPYVGSDHFPIYIKFNYEPVPDNWAAPEVENNDVENAKKIRELGEAGKKRTIIPPG